MESANQDLPNTQPVIPAENTQPVFGAAETISIEPASAPPAPPPAVEKSRRPFWRSAAFLGFIALLLIGGLSALFGYQSGIGLRRAAESTAVASQLQTQFNLAVQEADKGEYYRARQRLEYIIQNNPNFPGITELLAQVLVRLNATSTPTLMPSPTPTLIPLVTAIPDANASPLDNQFAQARQFLDNSYWSDAISTLLMIRKADPTYHAVDIDGMLFLALRNRGMDKIGKLADLEGGMYDLALAERFSPLDTQAQNYKIWASLYITGASFWELDWAQAVSYFAQIAPQLPGLTDGSGMTAIERYRRSLIGYGDFLMNEDACASIDQYLLALSISPDPAVEEALVNAEQECNPQDEDQDETGDEPPPPPTEVVPTATEEAPPPVEPTPTPTPES